MSDLIKRVADAIVDAGLDVRKEAAAATRVMLAALRDPSEAMREAAAAGILRRLAADHDRPEATVAAGWDDMLVAFVREHGLEEPPPAAAPAPPSA